MTNFDVVQTAPNTFCYDFNLNGSFDEGEAVTVSEGTEEQKKQAVLDAIVGQYEANSNGCFDHTKNKSPSYNFVLGKNVDVRFFSSWEEYNNVGKTEELFGPESKRGLSSQEVVRLRQELVKQMNLQITQLEALVNDQRLDAQHPLAQVVRDLKILRPILEKVRIEIVKPVFISASGQQELIADGDRLSRAAAYDTQSHVLELAEADCSDDFTQEEHFTTLANFLLPIVVHELDHAAMLTEGYVDDWTEHQYTYVSADGESCTTQVWNSPRAKFREDPATKVSLDFGLDFFSSEQPKIFHFDGVAWHYSAYPIYLGEKPVCVPEKYRESLKATEVHAFQTQARQLLVMHYQKFGLTAQDLVALLSDEEKLSDGRTKFRNSIVSQLEGQQWTGWNYQNILLHYLAAGEDMISHQKGQDIENYYTSRYKKPAPNPAECFEPQLSE